MKVIIIKHWYDRKMEKIYLTKIGKWIYATNKPIKEDLNKIKNEVQRGSITRSNIFNVLRNKYHYVIFSQHKTYESAVNRYKRIYGASRIEVKNLPRNKRRR